MDAWSAKGAFNLITLWGRFVVQLRQEPISYVSFAWTIIEQLCRPDHITRHESVGSA